jgi:hypothetical protein
VVKKTEGTLGVKKKDKEFALWEWSDGNLLALLVSKLQIRQQL